MVVATDRHAASRQPEGENMTIRTLKKSQGYTGEAQDEWEQITDGSIVVSYNTVRANADVSWRPYAKEEDWQDLPYVSADLPGSAEKILEFVNDYLELNEED